MKNCKLFFSNNLYKTIAQNFVVHILYKTFTKDNIIVLTSLTDLTDFLTDLLNL